MTPIHKLSFNYSYADLPEGGFIGYVHEVPGAISYAPTKEELESNLVDAIEVLNEFVSIKNRRELEVSFNSIKLKAERSERLQVCC